VHIGETGKKLYILPVLQRGHRELWCYVRDERSIFLIEQTITKHNSLCVVLDLDETIAVQHKIEAVDGHQGSKYSVRWTQDTDVVHSSRSQKQDKGRSKERRWIEKNDVHFFDKKGKPDFWLQQRPFWAELREDLSKAQARVYLYTMAVDSLRQAAWTKLNQGPPGTTIVLAGSKSGRRGGRVGKCLRDLVREAPYYEESQDKDADAAATALNSGIRPFVLILDDVQARERPKDHPQMVWASEDERHLVKVAPMNPSEPKRDVELQDIRGYIEAGRREFIKGLLDRAKELQGMETGRVAKTLSEAVRAQMLDQRGRQRTPPPPGRTFPPSSDPGTILVLDCNFLLDCFEKEPQLILDIVSTPRVTLTVTQSQWGEIENITTRKQQGKRGRGAAYPAARQAAADKALDFVDRQPNVKKQLVDDEFFTTFNLDNANFKNDVHLVQWTKWLANNFKNERVIAMTSDGKLCTSLSSEGLRYCKFEAVRHIFANNLPSRRNPPEWGASAQQQQGLAGVVQHQARAWHPPPQGQPQQHARPFARPPAHGMQPGPRQAQAHLSQAKRLRTQPPAARSVPGRPSHHGAARRT